MGEISDSIVSGQVCSYCGVYLDPKETVYSQDENIKMNMPENGDPMGFPVLCKGCKDD
jgi:hypothetical protein